MDRVEAGRLLRQEMTRYGNYPYADLVRLVDEIDAYEVRGVDGVAYQIEVTIYWTDQSGGKIQVLAGIDDGTIRGALRPVTDGFVKYPDDTVRMDRAVHD